MTEKKHRLVQEIQNVENVDIDEKSRRQPTHGPRQ